MVIFAMTGGSFRYCVLDGCKIDFDFGRFKV